MTTKKLYQEDAYLRQCGAEITAISDSAHASGGVVLSQTVFYPTGGGQPGDSGILQTASGDIRVAITNKDAGDITHMLESPNKTKLSVGDKVSAVIDWQRRHKHMRMHTAMHLLCACVPAAVTGGQVGEDKSRLDFNIGDLQLDKDELSERMNRLIDDDYLITPIWVDMPELDARPELVRTMSVAPPRTCDRIRLLKIGDGIDLQPCGGTHVARTSEIGAIRISKIENKGAKNRRINIVFA